MNNPNAMMMGSNQGSYCEALTRLKSEHVELTKQMQAFHELALKMVNKEIDSSEKTIDELKSMVYQFKKELEPHSEREEGILFEMMAQHIGKEGGPIMVMEHEHEQARLHLKSFKEIMGNSNKKPEGNAYLEAAQHAVQAYVILTNHFMKEETILFPMAERMLSEEEKQELKMRFDLFDQQS